LIRYGFLIERIIAWVLKKSAPFWAF